MPLSEQNPIWVAATLIGCIGYIGFQAACIILAFDAQGGIKGRAFALTAVGMLISLTLLILGLWRA